VEMKGSPQIQPIGECYRDAYYFLLREGSGLLVHGEVVSPANGRVIKHAWVELDDYVWEPQTQYYLRKSDFYDVFKPKVWAKYTPLEAARWAVKTKHFGPWEEERSGTDRLNIHDEHPSYTSMYNISMSSTLELKARFGPELKQMIAEAEGQKREVGAMLCRTVTGQPHLSRACWGQRGKVEVHDCKDHLTPLGSFHVHLGSTSVFSVPDLRQAIKREKLSCIGYRKSGYSYLKCVMPEQYYKYSASQRLEIDRLLSEAASYIERASRLFKISPHSPEAKMLSGQAIERLSVVEKMLDAYEVPLQSR